MRWLVLSLAVVLVGCTGPAATPSASIEPTTSLAPTSASPSQAVTATPAPVETPSRTTEPVPTPPPQATAPPIAVVSQKFALATAAPLIEVVGPYRTDTETQLRQWVPSYLEILDKYRNDASDTNNRSMFDFVHVPGPYTEYMRQSLGVQFAVGPVSPPRQFQLSQLAIQHMYAKPWGRVAYIDAMLSYVDRITASDGKVSTVQHAQQARFVNQGHGMYKVVDGYDPILGRWVDGEQPRWSGLALEAEAPQGLGWYLQRETYVPGETYPHSAPAGQRFLITAFDNAWNDSLAKLDASYTKGEFTTRRFDNVSVQVTRFEPASFLGDGVVTVVLNARLLVGKAGSETATQVTRTLRFYRITRDGLNAFWQVVDQQGTDGNWLSGGNLELAEIDQDRG